MESIDSLIEAIEAFRGAVVIVTHSELVLHAIATKLIIFDGGEIRVFDGTYEDFLGRIGWRDEGAVAAQSGPVEIPKGKGLSKKEMRRLRAEIVTNRSKILNPLQKRMTDIEDMISGFERRIEMDNQTLLTASTKGDGRAIRDLTKAIHETKEHIDSLFSELEEITAEHDAKSKEFDSQMNELQEAG
jgi:ATP-binding cassette subfamily F protein 3